MDSELSLTADLQEIQKNVEILTENVQEILSSFTPVKDFANKCANSGKFSNDCDSIINKCKQIITQIEKKSDEIKTFHQNLEENSNLKPVASKVLNDLNETFAISQHFLDNVQKAKISEEDFNNEDKIYTAKGRFHEALEVLGGNLKTRTLAVFCNLKKITRVKKIRSYFRSNKKCYVLLIANSKFQSKNLRDLAAIQKDVELTKQFETRNKNQFKIEILENQKFKQVDEKINELQTKDFSNYSSIVIIFDSHGDEKEIVYPTDGNPDVPHSNDTNMQSSDLWEWTSKNTSIVEQPVVVIVETCRGSKKERKYNYGVKTASGTTYYPNYPNLLVVYAAAYGYTASCNIIEGSKFLPKFLAIIEENNTKHWDILAQITKASRQVIEMGKPDARTQTVTFISVLQSQLKLYNNGIEHNWMDMKPYELAINCSMKGVFLIDQKMEKEAAALKISMEEAGIQIYDNVLPYIPIALLQHLSHLNEVSILFVVVIGLASCDEIHNEHMPNLREDMSYDKYAALIGRPKVVFFLGDKAENLPSFDNSSMNEQDPHKGNPGQHVSQNSDVLSYCDSNPGWLETIQRILKIAPGNKEGLVRLLTKHGIARDEILLSDSPPHIESSLRYKLVLPGPDVEVNQDIPK